MSVHMINVAASHSSDELRLGSALLYAKYILIRLAPASRQHYRASPAKPSHPDFRVNFPSFSRGWTLIGFEKNSGSNSSRRWLDP
jgi:hypothetical protein